MDKIIWNKDWCLDGGEIDKQHRGLINILNKIIAREINTNNLIGELISYAANHFIDEEILMAKNDYSENKYLLHKQEHRAFTKTLLEISFGLLPISDSKDFEKVVEKIEHFCFVWFNMHFLTTDKEFATFLKNKRRVH